MRILFCNYEYPPLGGGGGVVNAALAEELGKRHSVTVLTSRALGLPAESLSGGVRIMRAPVVLRRDAAAATFASMAAYVLTGTWAGRSLLRRERFDVINTHFALPTGPVGFALARTAAIPNVLTVHGGDLYDPSKRSSAHRHASLRYCVRRLAQAADAVVAQSRDTAANLRKFYAPELEPLIIPLGIAPPPAVHAARVDFDFDDRDTLLITVGRLVKRKAVDQLIDVLAELKNRRVKLIVIGSGPMGGIWQAHARERGVDGQVRFMGGVSDEVKTQLLSIADVYVSTSQHEGFGLVYVEAMAAGLPVVCYDTGGQRDFLHDGETGYVVTTNDRRTFAERCAELVRRPDRRVAIGRANRARARDYFIDRCAERYEALFESVLRRKAADYAPGPVRCAAPGSENGASCVATRE